MLSWIGEPIIVKFCHTYIYIYPQSRGVGVLDGIKMNMG